jgi:hypothetical protein
MRRPVAIAAGLCVGTLVVLAAVALAHRTRLSFTLGVGAATPAATLEPRQTVCQTPIAVPPDGGFDHVVLQLGTFHQPGPAVAVQVRALGSQRMLGAGAIPAGYADVAQAPERSVGVGAIPAGSQVEVCVLNRGVRKVAVYGNVDVASRTTTALLDGKPTGMDLMLRFERSPRSLGSLTGAMFDRAGLFKTSWAGGWTFWLLAALVLLAVPALLVRAVAGLRE